MRICDHFVLVFRQRSNRRCDASLPTQVRRLPDSDVTSCTKVSHFYGIPSLCGYYLCVLKKSNWVDSRGGSSISLGGGTKPEIDR